MRPSEKDPEANTFSVFNQALEEASARQQAPRKAAPVAPDSDFDVIRALDVLAQARDQTLPFAQFAKYVPGDRISTVTNAVKLMRDGWVEFVGQASENSEVRLTKRGRDMLDTLTGAVAKA